MPSEAPKANLGEWSELYTLGYLLVHGGAFAADENQNAIADNFHKVLKIFLAGGKNSPEIEYLIDKSSIDILGCTINDFKTHIENNFKDGMTWDNYSYYGWHIDHIIPLSSANSDEELMKLCHFTNLQPLWYLENLKKSNKLIKL